MIKKISVETSEQDSDNIGSTFIYRHLGVDHVILKTYLGHISLTNPEITWRDCIFNKKNIKLVNLEIKVID